MGETQTGPRWIALAWIGDENCEHTEIEELLDESPLEYKKRIVFAMPPWRSFDPEEIDDEDVEYELSKWDVFIFTNEGEVKKLKKIDLPDYPDLGFTVSETMWSVYRAFADEYIPGEEE